MREFIFTAIVLLAASQSRVSIKENQTGKEWKDSSDSEKIVGEKAG